MGSRRDYKARIATYLTQNVGKTVTVETLMALTNGTKANVQTVMARLVKEMDGYEITPIARGHVWRVRLATDAVAPAVAEPATDAPTADVWREIGATQDGVIVLMRGDKTLWKAVRL